MAGAEHRIALVEVVRPYAQLEQSMEEIAQRLGVVVDSAQQHRLAAERDAAVREPVAGFGHLGRELALMTEVERQSDAVLAEHLDQLGSDALRQEARDAGADAQELDVRDRP